MILNTPSIHSSSHDLTIETPRGLALSAAAGGRRSLNNILQTRWERKGKAGAKRNRSSEFWRDGTQYGTALQVAKPHGSFRGWISPTNPSWLEVAPENVTPTTANSMFKLHVLFVRRVLIYFVFFCTFDLNKHIFFSRLSVWQTKILGSQFFVFCLPEHSFEMNTFTFTFQRLYLFEFKKVG